MRGSAKPTYFLGLSAFVLLVAGSTFFNSCKPKSSNDTTTTTAGNNPIENGKALVAKHCTGCHELVPVTALSNDVWQYHTLPSMAKYVGISTYGNNYFKRDSADHIGVTINEWQTIVSYYKKLAPLTLDQQKRTEPFINDWAGFSVRVPSKNVGPKIFYTTLVAFDSLNHKIYSSDFGTSKLYEWDNNLKPRVVADLPTGAVNADFSRNKDGMQEASFTCIGMLEPMDYPNGKVVKLDPDAKNGLVVNVETDLSRPADAVSGDFNKDGLTDYVICAQGNLQGNLLWMKQNTDHTYTRNVVKAKPGAVQAVVGDFNKDGWTDIMALYGAVDEGLYMYLNDHKGGFTEKALLHFPPVYGSTSFQLADVNHDGNLDVIYTAGYNFRDSRILKPYHGLYIFTNTGNWKLKQSYFYPINGCTKAIASDFDGDGDLDIATCAFFADLKNEPAESFVYFEQDKLLHFKPHAIPVSKYGRWFTMAAGDYNKDGKTDIILGNYSKGLSIQANVNTNKNEQIPLIVLENHTKK